MTKSKNTKKALLASCLSMLLCVAMLVGSTFAWFTDSVTTGVNKIVAGNLDVELKYWDGDSYEDATNVSLFDNNALWEPGHTEVVYLQIHNAGSLDLKYKLSVNPDLERMGIRSTDGTSFKLSDYLVFKAIENESDLAGTYTRDSAKTEAGIEMGLKNYTKESELMPSDTYEYITLVVYMPESVGNEANYKTGTEAPFINLSVQLVATQAVSEEDSFGSDYDAGALYPFEVNNETVYLTQAENGLYTNAKDETDKAQYVVDQASVKALADLTNKGDNVRKGTVVLAADVDMENKLMYPISKDFGNAFTGTFDGGGHTITNLKTYQVSYGGGLIGQTIGGKIENLTVENCTIGGSGGGGNIVGGVVGYTHGNTTFENIHVKNCTVKGYGKVGGILGSANEPNITTNFVNCSVENVTIVGAYDCGGLVGLAMGTVNVDDKTKASVDVTWKKYRDSDPYVTLDTTISQTDDCESRRGMEIKGDYWLNGGYYYGAFAKYYVHYASSHDCYLDNTTNRLSYGETCVNTLD